MSSQGLVELSTISNGCTPVRVTRALPSSRSMSNDHGAGMARAWCGHGAGRLALERLVRKAEKAGFWKLVSRLFVENAASRRSARLTWRLRGGRVRKARAAGWGVAGC